MEPRSWVRRPLDRVRAVEPFIRRIVAGGLALVAGLWLVRLTVRWTAPWAAGVVLALVGVAGLAVGVERQLEY
ncbi:hypothetical protein [Haloarchaeobius iranensis]|uniref:Uncharacterized protein n=1 Tax=Haloarchaeobius iranensis TaxID=996166 RepID=A0A1G9ZI12_9EURY|nr:hypothetical protein [Haloarchaeobius iranensis]SDN20980.1 hypothetical protein SAMN05192554_12062 [Haloarchaeobius iranensis]